VLPEWRQTEFIKGISGFILSLPQDIPEYYTMLNPDCVELLFNIEFQTGFSKSVKSGS